MALSIITVVVTLILVIAQQHLSRRKNWLSGAVIPIVSVFLMVGIFYFTVVPITWKTLLPCVFIIALEILIWIDQRIANKRRELNKMKAKDI